VIPLTQIQLTQQDICAWLLSIGAKEYTDRTREPDVRTFSLARLENVPLCSCNQKMPYLHVAAFPDLEVHGRTHPGTCEFEVVGEGGDKRWMKALIYSIRREEVKELLPDITQTARAVWTAFSASLAHRSTPDEENGL